MGELINHNKIWLDESQERANNAFIQMRTMIFSRVFNAAARLRFAVS
jgi:hypothetical protein